MHRCLGIPLSIQSYLTPGKKAAFNGAPNLSVLDGWLIESCTENVTGWIVVNTEELDNGNHAKKTITTRLQKLNDSVIELTDVKKYDQKIRIKISA